MHSLRAGHAGNLFILDLLRIFTADAPVTDATTMASHFEAAEIAASTTLSVLTGPGRSKTINLLNLLEQSTAIQRMHPTLDKLDGDGEKISSEISAATAGRTTRDESPLPG